jgi:WD40 repeat protein
MRASTAQPITPSNPMEQMVMITSEAEFEFLKWRHRLDPPYYVNSTAISADGKFVVAGSFFHQYSPDPAAIQPPPQAVPQEFGTYLFDREGRQLWVDRFVGYEGVYWVAISGDGGIVASGGWMSSDPYQGYIRAYETANGPANILDYRLGTRVNALALSSDGSTLVGAADQIYLFQQANGTFPASPTIFPVASSGTSIPNSVQSIAITSDGKWIFAGDLIGNVYLIENVNGTIGKHYQWNNTSSLKTIHTVAMTPDGDWFAAAGNDSTVYLFSKTSMSGSIPAPAGTFVLDTGGRVGCVAICDDGVFLSAVGNQSTAGAVYGIRNNDGTMTQLWKEPTLRNPNSTSLDASGEFVTVADGYPDRTAGHFSLYDGMTGNLHWRYNTVNMNWPMFISANGAGICAGTDHGNVFYFTPSSTQD